MSFTYDPYEILQVSPDSSLAEIKQAYLYVARMYHPDKGGDTKTFQFIQKAYKDIIQSKKSGQSIGSVGQGGDPMNTGQGQADFMNLKQGYQDYTPNLPDPGYNPNQGFDSSQFNQRFREQFQGQNGQGSTNSENSGWTLDISEADYIERSKNDFERENAEIDGSLSSISRIFNHGAFDPNSFNRMFNWAKENHQAGIQDMEVYQEPEAAIQGAESMAFSEISDVKDTKNLSSLGYSDFQQVFQKSHKNPDQVDKSMLNKFSRQKDITREEALSQAKLRQRMSQYNSSDMTIKKGSKPDFSRPIPQGELYTGEKQKREKPLLLNPGIAQQMPVQGQALAQQMPVQGFAQQMQNSGQQNGSSLSPMVSNSQLVPYQGTTNNQKSNHYMNTYQTQNQQQQYQQPQQQYQQPQQQYQQPQQQYQQQQYQQPQQQQYVQGQQYAQQPQCLQGQQQQYQPQIPYVNSVQYQPQTQYQLPYQPPNTYLPQQQQQHQPPYQPQNTYLPQQHQYPHQTQQQPQLQYYPQAQHQYQPQQNQQYQPQIQQMQQIQYQPQQQQYQPQQYQQQQQQQNYQQQYQQHQQQYTSQTNHLQGFIPGQGGRMPPQIPMNSNMGMEEDPSESVESAMMKRIQSRQMDFHPLNQNQVQNMNQSSLNHINQNNQGYAIELPDMGYDPEVNVLKEQVSEMQQTIDVQHKLLKKLANKQGYKIN